MLNTSNNANVASYYKSNFVPMPDPLNHCGKEVFINKDLKDEFLSLTNQAGKNFNLLYFYKQIASLSNVGFFNSWVSTKTALSRRLNIEGGYVLYALWNGKVYVENIQINTSYQYEKGARNIPAGVYKVTRSHSGNMDWSVSDKGAVAEMNVVNTKHMAINGTCNDIQDAANFMPAFINYGFDGSEGQGGKLNDTYSLFFNPSHGIVASGWRAMRDSSPTLGGTQAASKLAQALILTGEKNQEINLTVHENGHALLKEALRIVEKSNQKLDQFTVFYANPTQNLHFVDGLRKKVRMKLTKKAPLINPASISQNITSGNLVSGAVVAERANPENRLANAFNFVKSGPSLHGMIGFTASAATPIGAAGWALSVAPYIVGQAPGMNKKVIADDATAFQEGTRAYKKLVWDSVHKMMVRA